MPCLVYGGRGIFYGRWGYRCNMGAGGGGTGLYVLFSPLYVVGLYEPCA